MVPVVRIEARVLSDGGLAALPVPVGLRDSPRERLGRGPGAAGPGGGNPEDLLPVPEPGAGPCRVRSGWGAGGNDDR